MKLKNFMIVLILMVSSLVSVMWFTQRYNIEHNNAIYFWIMLFIYATGIHLMGHSTRSQLIRFEKLVEEDMQALMEEEREESIQVHME